MGGCDGGADLEGKYLLQISKIIKLNCNINIFLFGYISPHVNLISLILKPLFYEVCVRINQFTLRLLHDTVRNN